MKFLFGLMLLSALTLGFAPPAPAQIKDEFGRKKSCPIPPPSPFKHTGLIVTEFDRTADRMRTTLEHPLVIGNEQDGIFMQASFLYQDRRQPGKSFVEVIFYTDAMHSMRQDLNGLALLADGKQVTPEVSNAYASMFKPRSLRRGATRLLLSSDSFVEVTRSKRVAAQLGSSEFVLSKNHLEALRELASLMTPAAKSWDTAAASR